MGFLTPQTRIGFVPPKMPSPRAKAQISLRLAIFKAHPSPTASRPAVRICTSSVRRGSLHSERVQLRPRRRASAKSGRRLRALAPMIAHSSPDQSEYRERDKSTRAAWRLNAELGIATLLFFRMALTPYPGETRTLLEVTPQAAGSLLVSARRSTSISSGCRSSRRNKFITAGAGSTLPVS